MRFHLIEQATGIRVVERTLCTGAVAGALKIAFPISTLYFHEKVIGELFRVALGDLFLVSALGKEFALLALGEFANVHGGSDVQLVIGDHLLQFRKQTVKLDALGDETL